MKTTHQEFIDLEPSQKEELHFSLCLNALSIWEAYTKQLEIPYTESVFGTKHIVDNTLPNKAYNAALKKKSCSFIFDNYSEPITSMQDGDLEFPVNIEFAYYAIYNLYLKYSRNGDIDDWLIVNQALSAEDLSEDQYEIKLRKEIALILKRS